MGLRLPFLAVKEDGAIKEFKAAVKSKNTRTAGSSISSFKEVAGGFLKGLSSNFKPVKIRISQPYQKKIFIPLYKKIISLILIQDSFLSSMGCCCSCYCYCLCYCELLFHFFFFYSMIIMFQIWRQMRQSFTSSGSLVGQQ